MSRCADQRYLTTQLAGQIATDGQAKTSTAVLPGGSTICLLERFEDQVVVDLVDPDAGVGDGDREITISGIALGVSGPESVTVTDPSSVNFTAFAARFFAICFTPV